MRRTGQAVRQRSELTFKHNADLGRHGWLRLTPACYVKLVEDVFEHEQPDIAVFDPFSGTGTTPLVAANSGWTAFSIDLNPSLTWLGTAKTARYSPVHIWYTRGRPRKTQMMQNCSPIGVRGLNTGLKGIQPIPQ